MALVLVFAVVLVALDQSISVRTLAIAAAQDRAGVKQIEATLAEQAELREYLERPIDLRSPQQTWRLTPAHLGLDARLDAETTASGRSAFAIDLERRWAGVIGLPWPRPIWPVVSLDADRLTAEIDRLAAAIDEQPVDARFERVGTAVWITGDRPGRQIDRGALAAVIRERLAARSTVPIDLSVRTVQPGVTAQDLEPVRRRAERLLSGPLSITYDQKRWDWQGGPVERVTPRAWTVGTEQIAAWIQIATERDDAGAETPAVWIDRRPIKVLAGDLAKEVYQPTRNARFAWVGGTLSPTMMSQDEVWLDTAAFVEGVLAALEDEAPRRLALPVRREKPPVAVQDAPKMGIVEPILERWTNFGGGVEERRFNVRHGADRLNGVVVPPGATFSFVDAVGDVTEEAGYKLGFAIIQGKTVPDPGGGICQVSTTLFQTVFFGGYEIVERREHLYRITRYEPPAGLDATVYPPELDFKFRNNGDQYLLIQTRTEGDRLFVALYGTRPPWTVQVHDPVFTNVVKADPTVVREESPQLAAGREVWVEVAQDGVDVEIRREIRQGDRLLRTDVVTSHYEPERNVLLVGTGRGE